MKVQILGFLAEMGGALPPNFKSGGALAPLAPYIPAPASLGKFKREADMESYHY